MNILVVEDDRAQQLHLCALLKQAGHAVHACDDGEQAWATYQRHRHPLLFVDWVLPGLDGLELCRRIRQNDGHESTLLLITTSRSEPSDLEEALDAGADDFVPKPYDAAALRIRLRIAERRIQDLAEHARTRETNRQLQQQMQQVQKLESLGVLAGGIAHDFNNLLVGVLGNAELAMLGAPPDSAIVEQLRSVQKSAMRAADLCKELLAYSGKGRFVVEPLNLSTLIAHASDLLTFGKSVPVRFELAPDLPAVEADATQLRQVVMNLVTNAMEAMADRAGTIVVRTGLESFNREELASTYVNDNLPPGQYVYVEVADTGIGMSEKTLTRIFDPFFTTKFAGRGLGLAAALGIVRSHCGAIQVNSQLGMGTRMKALFPVSSKEQVSSAGTLSAPEPLSGKGAILVVDDEAEVRTVACRVLAAHGYSPIPACDGHEAIRIFGEKRDQIDAVILDMTMPNLSGSATYLELRRIQHDVRVILTSGYNEQDALSRFDADGLAGFIAKPFQVRTIIDKVRQAIEMQRV